MAPLYLRDYLLRSTHTRALLLFTPLDRLAENIRYASLGLRKFMLNYCRTQCRIYVNTSLQNDAMALDESQRDIYNVKRDITYTFREIAEDLHSLLEHPVYLAVLTLFIRAERPYDDLEFLDQKKLSVQKELRAAFQGDVPQMLDYRSLFTEDRHEKLSDLCPQPPISVAQLWTSGIQNLAAKLFTNRIFFPQYNDQRNVGHWTSDSLNQRQAHDFTDRQRTSLDLLDHYHRTAEMIQGPCELRVSWKLNDLKPRCYYCLGGTAYFSALYIKEVCNLVQEILPCTNPATRFDIKRLTVSPLSVDEIIITYDYSSFTTSLAELKYFLEGLARSLKGCSFNVLDPYYGILELDLGDYIQQYNETINMNAEFSIHRLLDDEDATQGSHHQTRGGMLGVPGNIGFSTTLHGISLSSFTNTPHRDSCVGDDALLRIVRLYFAAFIQHTNLLGYINPDKHMVLETDPYGQNVSEINAYRYVKRPLSVDYLGYVQQGQLLAIPSFADVFAMEVPDPNRDVPENDRLSMAKKLATQTIRFYQTLERYDIVPTDSEMQTFFAIAKTAYDSLEMPHEGALPGDSAHIRRREYLKLNGIASRHRTWDFIIPPIVDDIMETNWREFLCARSDGETILVARTSSTKYLEPLSGFGSSAVMPSHPLMELLVKLGYIESTIEKEIRVVGTNFFATDIDELLAGALHPLYEYRQILEDMPYWYHDAYEFLDSRPLAY